MLYFAKLSRLFFLLCGLSACFLPAVAQPIAMRVDKTVEDPEKLADERRRLYGELSASRKDGILKSEEIARLKERNKELEWQEGRIKKLQEQLAASKVQQKKYKDDVQKSRDLYEQASMEVSTLEKQLKSEQDEKERMLKMVQQLVGEATDLQVRIHTLEQEKSALEQRVNALEQSLEEFDFYTALRVYEFKCKGYDKNALDFSFKLISERKPSDEYARDVEVVIEVLRKFKIGVYDKPTESCTGLYQRLTARTGIEQAVRFCSKELIERDNQNTGTLNEYTVNIKIIYRKFEIWVSKNQILDLYDCK